MDSLWSFASIVQSGYTLKLLSLRQSKRLGGIVRTGWVAGVFLSGLSLGNLAELVGTEHLILVSAGIGLAALFLNLSLSRAAKEKFQDGNAEDDAPKSTIGNFLRNRFVWLILATYMASFGSLYFTDMMFLNEMENRFTSESEFTAFFGMFAGIGSILVFLGQTFIFNRYIARFGLLAAMVACPVVMVAFSAGVMVAGAAEMTALLFWLIAGLRMSYTVVGSVMDDPTQGVLLEALPESQQVQLSNFMGGFVAPVATALVGGILLLLTVLEASSFTMSLTLIFLCLGWFFVSVFARNEYVKVIVDTVSRRKLPKASLEMDPEMMAKMITPKLESGIPGEVIYCLWLLEETRHKSLTLRLIEQLDGGKPTVARYAAERIEALVLDEAADAVARLAKSGPPGLRGRGLITYCALTESDALEEVVSYLDSDDDELRRGAIIGMLRYGGIDGVLAAGSKFNELRFSENPESRRMAAEIIGLIGISEFYRPLAQLLKDVDMEVRRAAVKSAAALRNPKLLPALLDALKTPELRVVAIAAITAYGNTVAPDLIDTFDDCVDHLSPSGSSESLVRSEARSSPLSWLVSSVLRIRRSGLRRCGLWFQHATRQQDKTGNVLRIPSDLNSGTVRGSKCVTRTWIPPGTRG